MDFIPSSNQLSDFRGLFYWGFIGHNFGDYKNLSQYLHQLQSVLSVTILETTKTYEGIIYGAWQFYRSQFWRLQKHSATVVKELTSFIGHNFGDYKNLNTLGNPESRSFIGHNFGDYKNSLGPIQTWEHVLSVTILETTKTVSQVRLI